ncbi:MAG: hypothetical protein GX163_12565 [Bacteroidetes bacterium]|jgi:uncharacterized protein YdaT|nr:hypothetical protein [Bacteroidota bacterium]
MEWTFKNMELYLKDLTPEVQEKAKEIAEKLSKESEYSEERIIKEAIKRAQEWLYNAEG